MLPTCQNLHCIGKRGNNVFPVSFVHLSHRCQFRTAVSNPRDILGSSRCLHPLRHFGPLLVHFLRLLHPFRNALVRGSEEVVEVLEVLVVVDPSVVMVPLVPGRAAQELGEDAVGHPRQVVPRVGLAEEVRHQEVVKDAGHEVLVAEASERADLLHHDVHEHLQEAVDVGVLHGLQGVEGVGGDSVVVPVHAPHLSEVGVVVGVVYGVEEEVVKPNPERQLSAKDAEARRELRRRRLLVQEHVIQPYRSEVRPQGIEPELPVPRLRPLERLRRHLPVEPRRLGPLLAQRQVEGREERDRREEAEGRDLGLEQRSARRAPRHHGVVRHRNPGVERRVRLGDEGVGQGREGRAGTDGDLERGELSGGRDDGGDRSVPFVRGGR
mmetsp:Transcript_30600/g.62458  ORF Transcript_30600/g.62458 Transcript_30600/m.62458 type:complete len:381 (+) Transcript_30600:147-1289(+)